MSSLVPPAATEPPQTSAPPATISRVRTAAGQRPPAPGYLAGPAVDAEDEEEVEQVEAGEEVLRQADVGAAARGIVQAQEDVDEAGGVAAGRQA